MKRSRDRVRILCGAILGAVILAAPVAEAQRAEPLPKDLEGIGITERLGAQVPIDLEFTAEDGATVALSDLVSGERPVLLTLVYYKCPMLCGLVLRGVVDGLKDLRWTPGREFEVVTVSINPLETPTLARLKKQNYLKEYGRSEAAAGWHFLTGTEDNVRRLADAVGFAYRWDEESQQFVHAAGIFVLTPRGKVARTLFGVSYEPTTLKLALTEAGEGTVGRPSDQLLLYCFRYDADAGRYVVAATNVMRLGGGATALIVGIWLGAAWWRGAHRMKDQDGPVRT